jgi:hypothetical protein
VGERVDLATVPGIDVTVVDEHVDALKLPTEALDGLVHRVQAPKVGPQGHYLGVARGFLQDEDEV